MKPRFETLVSAPESHPDCAPEGACSQDFRGPPTAIPTERVHSVLRRMSDQDWVSLKALMDSSLTHPTKDGDIEVLDRMFRKGEAIGRQAGGIILQMVQAITAIPRLLDEVRKAHERLRERVRFVLREMSDEDWQNLKACLERNLTSPSKAQDIAVLEIVFRIGESVSNVEVAALGLANRLCARRLIDPEVARANAATKARVPGAAKVDPQAAYLEARNAIEQAKDTARRAANTLASRYVEATAPYKHARSTVFKTVDSILDNPELMAELTRIEKELAAAAPLSREQIRWALHRMPVQERVGLIKLIPLNTILMYQDGNGSAQPQDLDFKATRDRRLAFDLFISGQGDDDLMARYGLGRSALNNTVGAILHSLVARPLARKRVHEYLAQVQQIEPMPLSEVRRRMKQLSSGQRGEILAGIPHCTWKIKEVIPLHKSLCLDYLTGEWLLDALVDYYNLEKPHKLTGTFRFGGTLTPRGANAAIEGILHKIAGEPALRQQLRRWTSSRSAAEATTAEPPPEPHEPTPSDIMPSRVVVP
jgi:hypothetical protein